MIESLLVTPELIRECEWRIGGAKSELSRFNLAVELVAVMLYDSCVPVILVDDRAQHFKYEC